MNRITLTLDEKTLKAGREYAREHNLTLNALIRGLLQQTISKGSRNWTEECFALMDKAAVGRIKKWKREDLYS
jgi:hypothetical protein